MRSEELRGYNRDSRSSSMVATTPKSTLSSKTRSSSVGSSSVMSSPIGSVGSLKSDTYCNGGTYKLLRAPHATNERNNNAVNSKYVNVLSQSFSGVPSNYEVICLNEGNVDKPKDKCDESASDTGDNVVKQLECIRVGRAHSGNVYNQPNEPCNTSDFPGRAQHQKYSVSLLPLSANSQLTTESHRNSTSSQLKSSTDKIIAEHKPFPKDGSHSDRYSAIAKVEAYPGQGYTGWSTAVLGTGLLGWSDELLNVDLEANVGNSILYVDAPPQS